VLARTSTSAEARFNRTAQELALVQAAIVQRVDTRGDAFRMTIGDRRTIERPEAGRLIAQWIATHDRGGIPYGRPQHPLGEVSELGGFAIDATLRRALSATPNVELTLRGVPTQPAVLGLDVVRQDPSSLCASSRRIQDLPALAERGDAAGGVAAEEAARAQHGLAQPFKHADALKAATVRSSEIAIEMQHRQQPPPGADAGADRADAAPEAKSAEASELQRLSRANFPTAPGGRPTGTATPAPARPRPPQRGNDVSR